MGSVVNPRAVATNLTRAEQAGLWFNDGKSLALNFASLFGIQFDTTGGQSQALQAATNELAYSPTLTFNGFQSEIGVRQNFDSVNFSLYPYNSDYLPTQCRVQVCLGTYDATPLVDIIIPITNAEVDQPIPIFAELGESIANAGSAEVWLTIVADGRVGYASSTTLPGSLARYFAADPAYTSMTGTLTSTELVSPYGEIFAKTFNSGSRYVYTNGYFASTQYTTSTFSAWGNNLSAVPQQFNLAQIWMNAFDSAKLPTQARIIFRDTDYTGTVLATATANVSFGTAGRQLITFFFDDDVDLSGYADVWCGFATDGFVSLCASNTLVATNAVYGAGPSGIDGAVNTVVSGETHQPWLRTVLLDRSAGIRYDKGLLGRAIRSSGVIAEAFIAKCDVNLPPSIFAVTGQEVNIYYDGAINSWIRPDHLVKSVGAGIGRAYRYRWTDTPSAAANSSLSLSAIFNGDVLSTATTTIKTKATTVGNGQSRKALFIGDSMTATPTITQTVLDNVTANSDSTYTLELIGTVGSGANLREGYNGWSYDTHATNAASPFVTGGEFDFDYYLTNNSFTMSSGDSVFILLGTNDLFGADTDGEADSTIATMSGHLATMIASIQSAVSGINIFIGMIPQIAYDADAFAPYLPNQGYPDRIKRNYGRWRSFLIATYGGSEASKIYLAAINCCVDTRNNFQTTTRALNGRNATLETVISDPVHPDTSGYQQIGDYCYACLMSLET